MDLWSFYHVYADGDWHQPVTEHCKALTANGLYDELAGWYVGFVGAAAHVAEVRATLDVLAPGYEVCAVEDEGWEQVTLTPLWRHTLTHDGLVSYGHTKGASRVDPIDQPWRRCMEYHNFVEWQRPVKALTDDGYSIAGCYWVQGGALSRPGYGHGGMFGGNFWWTRCELLRHNPPPDLDSRHHAEHWLGQLSEVTPLTAGTICDLNPMPIGRQCEWSG